MIRLVLPQTEIPEFDKCVQLSAAVARGDQAAGRITSSSAASTVGRAASATRTTGGSSSNRNKYSTAPVRLRHTSQSPHRCSTAAAGGGDRHRKRESYFIVASFIIITYNICRVVFTIDLAVTVLDMG